MLLFLPILIPLLAAVLCLLFRTKARVQQVIALLTATAFLTVAVKLFFAVYHYGIQTAQAGNWPAPFGITLVADMFSALMLLIAALIFLLLLIYSLGDIHKTQRSKGLYPVLLFLLSGVAGSLLAGDVFNLYVWFEVMLIASFVLIALGGKKAQLEGAVKYVVLNFIGSGFFLTGVGLLYRVTGTLNMAALAELMNNKNAPELITLPVIFFFMGFGIKSAVAPLFFWLPASYHTPPAAVSALLGGLLTKIGVYTMVRVFSVLTVPDREFMFLVLLTVAGLSMLVGVLGAIAHNDFRKILSFHIISQIGYMVMGLAIFTPLALAGAIFFVVHNIIVKTNLFLISGITRRIGGHYHIDKLGGLYSRVPLIAFLFLVTAFSLAGIPPLSGFWGKFMLAKAGFESQQVLIVVVSLVVSLLTLFSMTKIWSKAFWSATPKHDRNETTTTQTNYLMVAPVLVLGALTLGIGLFPSLLVEVSLKAAEQLLHPEAYIDAVLNN